MAAVPECLVSLERNTVVHGSAYADNPDAISTDLMSEVRTKAHRMVTWYHRPGDRLLHAGHCQMGFLRRQPIRTSPGGSPQDFAVYPVTSKHNIRRVVKEAEAYDATSSEVIFGLEGPKTELCFPGLN